MASMRSAADDSYKGKLDRMGLGISTASTGAKGIGDAYPQADGSQGMAQGSRAAGYATERENEQTMAEKAPKKLRLDRQPFKNGGAVKKGTTVNVIVAPQGGPEAPPPMPPPGAMPPPPPMPKPPIMPAPGGGPEMAGAAGPPPMMRARGGRVPMDHGAGGGLGRLDKIKEYGARAKPGGKAGTL